MPSATPVLSPAFCSPASRIRKLWIKSTSFFYSCQVNVYLRSFSDQFPCCFLWQCQLKMCPKVLLPLCWMGAGAVSGNAAHLQDSISVALLPSCSQGGLPVSRCSSGPGIVASSCAFHSPLFFLHLPFGLLLGWEVVCGGTCANADSLLSYLLLCRRGWGGAQPHLLLCSPLVR